MIVKKRITNRCRVKGTLFFVHNLRWVCSRKGEKRRREKRKEENKKSTVYINSNK